MELSFKTSTSDVAARSAPSYGPLPAGEYECMVMSTDTRPTKAGTGNYLELTISIISGEHSGRRHWERLNLDNPNKQTVDIARKQLAQLCLAVGLAEQRGDEIEINITDSSVLHDRPFVAELGIDKKDPSKNVIWNYRSISGPPVSPAKLAASKPPAPPAPPAAAGRPARPWG